MKLKCLLNCRLIMLLLLASLLPALQAKKKEWSSGHGDMVIEFENNKWVFRVIEEDDPGEVIIVLGADAMLQIPDNPAFSFLGEPGEPIWVIPQTAAEGVVYMGVETSGIPAGTFENNRMDLVLSSVSGPGDFLMWVTSGPGEAQVLMNSRDGITGADRDADRPAPGHWHRNWGFTAAGTYKVGFRASAVPVGAGLPVTSPEAIYTFEVNVLKSGEVEIEIEFEENELHIEVVDEESDRHFSPQEVALRAGPKSRQLIPEDPRFAFLGEAGEAIYILPQEEREGVLFLGISGEAIPAGVFVNDQIALNLNKVEGPGDIFLYSIDPFGRPVVHFNSADGISSADSFAVIAGGHSHQNLAFSKQGLYRVTVQAKGVLAAGGGVESEEAVFTFEIWDDVPDALELKLSRVDQQTIRFLWDSSAGAVYQLQAREAFGTGDWVDEGAPRTGNGQPLEMEIEIE